MSPEQQRERCRVEGFELIEGPTSRGQGVVLLAGHFGNWEAAAVSMTSRGVPVDAVARRQRNPLFDEYVLRTREHLGTGRDSTRGNRSGPR